MLCFLAKYSEASVGPNPRYTDCDRMDTASCSMSALILRLDGSPRNAWATTLSPRRFSLPQQASHVPFRDPQFFSYLLLGDQFLLRLLQGHQAVPFGLRHH